MIGLIDYGISNLRSVQKAFAHLGVAVTLIDTPDQLAQAERLILPGVGAFRAGMDGLRSRGLIEPIKSAVAEGKPLMGICLGMQLLFESSDELGDTVGLGLLPGHVTKIKMQDVQSTGSKMQEFFHAPRTTHHALKIPHMGWNQLDLVQEQPLVNGVESGAYAYFVHSYAVYPEQTDIVIATTEYGGPFASIVGRGNICGLQFHPEKSQAVGLRLLENFLTL
ncbi:MAG: imidazole glycerol phosphate synthase subunit HisH [Thermoflexales bacterium]|nr:imidazole glycerol phosphate synthase subunit HisH [Thermoflexales bacterium]